MCVVLERHEIFIEMVVFTNEQTCAQFKNANLVVVSIN